MARTRRCIHCGRSEREATLYPFHHSTGTRYTCERCAPLDVYSGYGRENGATAGNTTKAGFTLSKEFELPGGSSSYFGREGVAYFVSQQFDPTEDCTVWIEMKSPIYKNLNAWTRTSKAIEARFGTEWTRLAGYGTHTNVGHPDLDMAIVRQWYKSLFGRLYNTLDEVVSDRAERHRIVDLFGRTPVDYAHIAHGWELENPQAEHSIIWNVQHETHLECRLVKWTNATQDNNATKYAIETVAAVVEFCNEVKSNRLKTGIIEERIAMNRKSAEKAGRKIDNILRKHLGLPRENKTTNYTSRR